MTPSRLLRLTAVTVVAAACHGCVMTEKVDPADTLAEASRVPEWAVALHEPVDAVPLPPSNSERDVLAVDRPYQGETRVRGLPRDLTGPITSDETAKPIDRNAGRTGGSGGGGRDGDQFILNIHTAETAEPIAVEPDTTPSPLEKLYAGDVEPGVDRRVEQFGYAFFETARADPGLGPVSDNYRIGPGDELLVTIAGSFSAYHELEVDRDGRIALPDIGPVAVAGQRFDQLTDTLDAAIGQTRRDFTTTVALGRLRMIRVHVVGEVQSPGPIDIPARASVLDALTAAGGPLKTGSLRRIEWRAADAPARDIDLYDLLLSGNQPTDAPLADGDTLHVPPIGTTLAVAGYVQRPGIYEFQNAPTVEQALELAGGLTPFTFTPRLQLERTVDGRGRETLDIELNDAGLNRPLGDGQMLLVGAVDQRLRPVVRVTGPVVRPGTFQYRSGMRVSDLIDLADGVTVDAHLPQAFISRQVGQVAAVGLVPQRLAEASTRRVIVVDLSRVFAGDRLADVALLPLDHITVRSRSEATVRPQVEVIGAVQRPGRFELTSGLRVSELIALAGNVTADVYYDQAELIRRVHDDRTGQLDVQRYRFNLRDALAANPTTDPPLQSGDRLVIRRMRQAEVIARIDGQVRFPGEYIFPAGAKVTDLIAAAGGLVDDADLRAAAFTRQSVRDLQRTRFAHLIERSQRVFEDSLRSMVQSGQPREGVAAKLALQDTEQMLDRMRSVEATGRVVIALTEPDYPESPFNLVLEEGDALHIPRRQQTVSVIGCVFTPGSFVAAEHLSVDEAIDRVGGTTEFADEERVYVIRADGNVESLAQTRHNRLDLDALLLPGDVVLVPRRPPSRTVGAQLADTLALLRETAELSLIASQIGRPINDLNFSTVTNGNRRGDGITAYQEAILEETRR